MGKGQEETAILRENYIQDREGRGGKRVAGKGFGGSSIKRRDNLKEKR